MIKKMLNGEYTAKRAFVHALIGNALISLGSDLLFNTVDDLAGIILVLFMAMAAQIFIWVTLLATANTTPSLGGRLFLRIYVGFCMAMAALAFYDFAKLIYQTTASGISI